MGVGWQAVAATLYLLNHRAGGRCLFCIQFLTFQADASSLLIIKQLRRTALCVCSEGGGDGGGGSWLASHT